MVAAGLGDLRIADLPTGRAEGDGLAFEVLDAGRRLTLLEGEVEDVVGAHLEHRDERAALLDHQRVDAGRGIGDVRLAGIDGLGASGGLDRARLQRSRDVAEVTHLHGNPIGIVIEHVDRATRRHPAHRVVGWLRDDDVAPLQRLKRRATQSEGCRALDEAAPRNASSSKAVNQRIQLMHRAISSTLRRASPAPSNTTRVMGVG
jgi:hypothetical protein